MKAGILESVGRLVVREVPDPEADMGSVVLRVKVCAICGTDLRIYRYGDRRVKLPHILGHEISGELTATGEGVTNYKVGERVAVTPRIACGRCFYCQKGQFNYCLNASTFGYQLPGGFAEYLRVPPDGLSFGVLQPVPDALTFEVAALAEPLSCCIRAQRLSRVSPGDTIVVVG
ncbi:MAG: alcohol dehydrogenase catalytic domain-containing protein, partial [Chloroflexota bacterium]